MHERPHPPVLAERSADRRWLAITLTVMALAAALALLHPRLACGEPAADAPAPAQADAIDAGVLATAWSDPLGGICGR